MYAMTHAHQRVLMPAAPRVAREARRAEQARHADIALGYHQLVALVVTVWLLGAAGMAVITIG